MTARIPQHKSVDHANLSVYENLHTIERLRSSVPFKKDQISHANARPQESEERMMKTRQPQTAPLSMQLFAHPLIQ